MVAPLSFPVAVACSPANLLSESIADLFLGSRVYTLSPTTRAYLEPLPMQARVQSAGLPAIICLAPHIASLTWPVKVSALPAAKTDEIFFSSRRRHTRFDCDWSSDVCSSD